MMCCGLNLTTTNEYESLDENPIITFANKIHWLPDKYYTHVYDEEDDRIQEELSPVILNALNGSYPMYNDFSMYVDTDYYRKYVALLTNYRYKPVLKDFWIYHKIWVVLDLMWLLFIICMALTVNIYWLFGLYVYIIHSIVLIIKVADSNWEAKYHGLKRYLRSIIEQKREYDKLWYSKHSSVPFEV